MHLTQYTQKEFSRFQNFPEQIPALPVPEDKKLDRRDAYVYARSGCQGAQNTELRPNSYTEIWPIGIDIFRVPTSDRRCSARSL